MFNIIVACTTQGGIGRGNCIPWHIPADFKYFASVTTGSVVIMGRKTWESLPVKPLPNRMNIIVSSTLTQSEGNSAMICSSLQHALDCAHIYFPSLPVFVIGGSALYHEALLHPDCARVLLTLISNDISCDTYFPMDMLKSRYVIKNGSETKQREYNSIKYTMLEFIPNETKN